MVIIVIYFCPVVYVTRIGRQHFHQIYIVYTSSEEKNEPINRS